MTLWLRATYYVLACQLLESWQDLIFNITNTNSHFLLTTNCNNKRYFYSTIYINHLRIFVSICSHAGEKSTFDCIFYEKRLTIITKSCLEQKVASSERKSCRPSKLDLARLKYAIQQSGYILRDLILGEKELVRCLRDVGKLISDVYCKFTRTHLTLFGDTGNDFSARSLYPHNESLDVESRGRHLVQITKPLLQRYCSSREYVRKEMKLFPRASHHLLPSAQYYAAVILYLDGS